METENTVTEIVKKEITYWKKSWIAYVSELFSCIFSIIFYFILAFIVIFPLDWLKVLNAKSISLDLVSILNTAGAGIDVSKLSTSALFYTLALSFLCSVTITLIGFIFRIIWLKVYRIYYDDNGIWIYSGIFPWTRGVHGIKWRDLDGARYRTGFISWVTHSYDTFFTHRFTKESTIRASHLANGSKFVTKVSKILDDFSKKNNEMND